jgi:alpha-L-fucosidase
MKNLKICSFLIVLILSAVLDAQTRYTASWASVDKHTPSPEWFKDAKFGIYFHWGVFCVPAFGDEWYPRWMYCNGNNDRNHHVTTYGDPNSNWPYHNFINGANDKSGKFVQFAPKLTSEGGKFDPVDWANLFDSAGAKFAGPVAEHHDGFSMWDSKVSEWNSVQKGPKLDLAALFASAIRAKGMKYMMAMHHAYNFNGFYEYVPAQNDPSLKKLYGQLGSTAENQLWYDKLKEIIDLYKPDLIWQDWQLNNVSESQRLNFLAYYYNKALDWNKEVVATYKANNGDDGFNTKGEVGDIERGGPADIKYPYWLTDDAISSSSWCYTEGINYYSTVQMLHSLIDRVSKNGNMLLNISPMADGTIPQKQRTVLLGIGEWLRRFGESIYATRAWTVYGEGPTRAGGGAFSGPMTGTNKDWRFTCTKDTTTLYATCLGWPGNGANVTISSVTTARFKATGVYLFDSTKGSYIKLNNFNQSASGVSFTMPSTQPYTALAYAFKITSDRSTAINQARIIQDKPVSTVSGALSYGTLSWRSIQAHEGAIGVEVFTLQGKKIMRCMFDNPGNGEGLNNLQKAGSSQAYYIKYINSKKAK